MKLIIAGDFSKEDLAAAVLSTISQVSKMNDGSNQVQNGKKTV